VTVQVLTDQLRAEIVVAIKGNVAVQAALQNFQSSTGRLRRVSEAAASGIAAAGPGLRQSSEDVVELIEDAVGFEALPLGR
jgi:hypothetical protein